MPITPPSSGRPMVVPSTSPATPSNAPSLPATTTSPSQPASTAVRASSGESSFAEAKTGPCFLDTPPSVKPKPFTFPSASTGAPPPEAAEDLRLPVARRFEKALADGTIDRNDVAGLLRGCDQSQVKEMANRYSQKMTPEARFELNKQWVTRSPADLQRVLYKDDLPPLTERFQLAAADQQISRGEINDLLRSMAATKVTDQNLEQLNKMVEQYAPTLSPEAKERLQVFLKREVPLLRLSPKQLSQRLVTSWQPPVMGPGQVLAGYRIYVGSQPGIYDRAIDIADPRASGFTLENVESGSRYLACTAYTADGQESLYSNEIATVVP